jgi:hypothetical protein
MRRKGNFARYTVDELAKLTRETDWAKVDATTREEIERQAQADDGPLPEGWEDTVVLGIPRPKRGVYLRLDPGTCWTGSRGMRRLSDPYQCSAACLRARAAARRACRPET